MDKIIETSQYNAVYFSGEPFRLQRGKAVIYAVEDSTELLFTNQFYRFNWTIIYCINNFIPCNFY